MPHKFDASSKFNFGLCSTGCPLFLNTDFSWLPWSKIMQIHNLSALNRRQLWIVCNCRQQKIGCWLKVVATCQRFNAQWITGFTLWLLIFANSYNNSITLQSFSMMFPWLMLFSMIFQVWKMIITKFNDFPWLGDNTTCQQVKVINSQQYEKHYITSSTTHNVSRQSAITSVENCVRTLSSPSTMPPMNGCRTRVRSVDDRCEQYSDTALTAEIRTHGSCDGFTPATVACRNLEIDRRKLIARKGKNTLVITCIHINNMQTTTNLLISVIHTALHASSRLGLELSSD